MILIEDNFFTESDCNLFKNLFVSNEKSSEPYRDIFILDLLKVEPKLTAKLCSLLSSFLSHRGVKAFPETIQIVKWPTNSKQDLHVDKKYRILTSITYLNNSFKGGETYFTNGVVIKPEIGKTVFFDGKFYEHGVNQVEDGERYVIATWYSNDINELYI
jgi:hypothetical protein